MNKTETKVQHPESQKQHRIPQVYMKHFGFEREGVWFVTVWDKTKDHTDIARVNEFSTTINEFDTPYEDFELRRHFETCCSKVEYEYHKVINSLHKQKRLTERHHDVLCHFITSLICRSEANRWFFSQHLFDPLTRDRFLEEITIFFNEDLTDLRKGLELLQPDFQLNFVIGNLANHLVRILRSFNAVVLKDFDNRGWFTSDNPVIEEHPKDHPWLFSADTELYFPLSKDFCLFMFNENSENKDNPLRRLSINKIHLTGEAIHDMICKRTFINDNRFVIFPGEMEPTSL